MLEWLEVKCLFFKACLSICPPIHPRNICWGFTIYCFLKWMVPGTGTRDSQWELLLLFCHYVVSDSLWPHGLQHARLPCPSLSPGIDSNSCPLSQWCHPTISSCVSPFSFCLQSFPASEPFPMSQLFTSGGQSIGASAFFFKCWSD